MTNLTDPPEQPQAIKLDPAYDCCLLGASIGLETDRFAYSVTKLLRFERARLQTGSTAEAREELAKDIMAIQREHGPLSPIFINDELVLGDVVDGDEILSPKIITPGDTAFKRPNGRGR